MQESQALRVLEQLADADQLERAGDRLTSHLVTLLCAAQDRIGENDDESGYEVEDDEAAAIFSLVERMRADADAIERDLIRHLKFDRGMTWQEVAGAVDGQLAGRQAMQKRWSRLTSPARRTTTRDMRRGAAVPRHNVNGNDTTTATVEVEA